MKNTSDYGYSMTKEKLDSIIEEFEKNRKNIHVAFEMRDRTKGKLDGTKTLALLNKVLDRWCYSKVKSDDKRIRLNGKRVNNSEYKLEENGNEGFDIRKEVKPYKMTEVDTLHPLLDRNLDKNNRISQTELEDIRLHRNMIEIEL